MKGKEGREQAWGGGGGGMEEDGVVPPSATICSFPRKEDAG